MNAGAWSDAENDAVVAAYFSMLSDELSGRSYNKKVQNLPFGPAAAMSASETNRELA